MKVNILITSISRKVWLVKAFKDALREVGIEGNVISVDTNPLSAALYVSDKHYIVPSSSDPNFILRILGICKKEKVKLVIPARDGELLLFAKNKDRFEKQKIYVMVSNPKVIKTCNDKYKFYQFLIKNDIPTPKTFLKKQIDFHSSDYPVIVKSRTGSGSKKMFRAKNKEELKFFINYIFNPVIQEVIDGREYTVDLFSDFNKRVLTVLPRERIETFSGESYKAKIVKDEQIISLAKNIAQRLETIGHITLQFIKNGDSLKLIEINPRFGGGAMLGIESGHNTPLLLIKLVSGENIKPQIGNFKDGLIMLRYTSDLFILDGNLVE